MRYRSNLNLQSGVYPVPLFTKEYPCGGDCIFCPQDSGFPKSYIENEDTQFARQHSYSPSSQFLRFVDRLPQKYRNKSLPIEVIILGGSFSSLDREYRKSFCNELYAFMSGTEGNAPENQNYIPSIVTVESRPDQINHEECNFLREIGVSKVELGVQHTSNKVLRASNRGHDNESVIKATQILKDEGFKVGYHIMLGLPYATFNDDLEMLTQTLWRDEYTPDYLKIYPCTLLKERRLQPTLYDLYKLGEWEPMTETAMLDLLKALSINIPSYVRISRLQRQLSQQSILAGLRPGIRERSSINFGEVREREIGRLSPEMKLENIELIREQVVRENKDIFIELLCGQSTLLGIARMRLRNNEEIILRELRVFGEATPIGHKGSIQGKGLGTRLLDLVETIGQELNASICLVNAAFGARPFFKKRGYFYTEHGLLSKKITQYKVTANKNNQLKSECSPCSQVTA